MTDSKKKGQGKSQAKAKKLQLNKETLKDISLRKGAGPKGGAGKDCLKQSICSYNNSGCA